MLGNGSKNSILSLFNLQEKNTVARAGDDLVSTYRQYLNPCCLKRLSVLKGSKLLFLVQNFSSPEMEKASLEDLIHKFCLTVFENVVEWGQVFFPLLFKTHVSGGLGALALLIMQNSLS